MAEDILTIRLAVPGDLAAVDALLARSYPALLKADYPPSVMVLAVPFIARAQPRLLASGSYFVVERGGRIVAAGGWTRDRRQGRVGHVRHVVTDAGLTRRGIGRALMGHVAETAAAAGIARLDCQSTRTAEPFYAACGFRRLGPVEVPLGAGIVFPAIAMTRGLGDRTAGRSGRQGT